MNQSTAFFAPQPYIKQDVTDIRFYEKVFGAVEIMRFTNDDGSIHVAKNQLWQSSK